MSSAVPFHGFVAVQARGLVALHAALRKKYRLDEPGAQVEITERADGILEFRPTVAVPADEAWFWQESWQAGEREVDEHIARGEVTTHPDVDNFLQGLDNLDSIPE